MKDVFLASILGLNVGLGVYLAQTNHPAAGFSFGAAAFLFYLGIV